MSKWAESWGTWIEPEWGSPDIKNLWTGPGPWGDPAWNAEFAEMLLRARARRLAEERAADEGDPS